MENELLPLKEKIDIISNLFKDIIKKANKLKDESFVEKGLIIKNYSIKYELISIEVLNSLESTIKKLVDMEERLQKDAYSIKDELLNMKLYYKGYGKKLDIESFYTAIKELLYYADLMLTRLKQLREILKTEIKLDKYKLEKEGIIFLSSLENVSSKFISYLKILDVMIKKFLDYEYDAYLPLPRVYGRAMNKKEFKETIENKRLSSSKSPTPVFDAPTKVRDNIINMNRNERKDFFGDIGVEEPSNIIFFQTKLKPMNEKPIPQSNGLREYKFPKGISIEILRAA